MSDTPRTDKFASSCATNQMLVYAKQANPDYKPNIMELEFVLALDHARALEKEARELLSEAQHMLAHSRCKDDDATKCPACSLESRIDAVLADPK